MRFREVKKAQRPSLNCYGILIGQKYSAVHAIYPLDRLHFEPNQQVDNDARVPALDAWSSDGKGRQINPTMRAGCAN